MWIYRKAKHLLYIYYIEMITILSICRYVLLRKAFDKNMQLLLQNINNIFIKFMIT